MLLEDVIQRGTRAAQPAATAVATGTLYYVTDEGVTERSNATTWDDYSDAGDTVTRTVGIVIDGGGSVISTGIKGFVSVNFGGQITRARLLSIDASVTSGSIVIDVWKDTYANFPPTVADTITASAKPTLSSATKSDDTTLTGWSKTVTAGDVFGFKVDSVTSLTKVILQLTVG
jgi:hypothetical protein